MRDTICRDRPDVLLATGSSGGTIAAVRELSKSGVRVSVISNRLFCAASWSRFASQSHLGPPEREGRRFIDLLLKIGSDSPGKVLLPTSDETAWLYTRNAPSLSKYFRLNLPPVETMERILDKKGMAEAAAGVGIAVLPTWGPRTFDEVEALAPTLPYPILIKPRTQVNRRRNDKGTIASCPAELLAKCLQFVAREDRGTGDHLLSNAQMPLLQSFVEVGPEGVYSVSGYIDKSGELFVARHTTKVLQRSQPAGVGVCFEALPTNPRLSSAVYHLCRELGYFGIFEVEFIRFGGGWAIIDFNPRLFNQIAMDACRGMPLALFAYLEAADRLSELRDAVAVSREDDRDDPFVFYDNFTLRAILMAKTLTGRISREERTHWRSWMKRNESHSVDFARDKTDPLPGLIHAVSETILGVKAVSRFLHSTPQVVSEHVPAALKVQL